MTIIYNNIIPFPGFVAMSFCGICFVRKDRRLIFLSDKANLNHEEIHLAQQKELLFIGFYLLYILFWLFNLITFKKAYMSIPFEKEAYFNELNNDYLKIRKPFAWLKY